MWQDKPADTERVTKTRMPVLQELSGVRVDGHHIALQVRRLPVTLALAPLFKDFLPRNILTYRSGVLQPHRDL